MSILLTPPRNGRSMPLTLPKGFHEFSYWRLVRVLLKTGFQQVIHTGKLDVFCSGGMRESSCFGLKRARGGLAMMDGGNNGKWDKRTAEKRRYLLASMLGRVFQTVVIKLLYSKIIQKI